MDKKETRQKRDADQHYNKCIGEDGKQHICYPWSDKCYCGVAVIRKKLLRDDWKRLSCYECTF